MPRWILVAVLLTSVSSAGIVPEAMAQGTSEPDTSELDTSEPRREILDRRPGQGEECLVCKQAIHGADVVEVRYQGRRFHVKAEMLEAFDQDPDAYFQELQGRSGLFDERAVGGGRVSYGWLAFGAYMVLGLIFAAICGYLAIHRGHLPLPWFFAGLAGNVAALFVLYMTPRGSEMGADVRAGLTKVALTRPPLPCAACGATNHPSAAVCGGCQAALVPGIEAETARI